MRFRKRTVPEVTVATTYDLRIKGSVESLHLEPGDKVIISTDMQLTPEQVQTLKGQGEAVFPDNEVVILTPGIRINRQEAAA